MKKSIFLLILVSLFLTGCTNDTNYINNLYQKRGDNISYIINVKTLNKNNEYVYFKSYIKGDKWKTIITYKNEENSKHLYNGGNKIYQYNIKTGKHRESYVSDDMKQENALNIVGPIIYWKKPVGMSLLDSKPKLISTNTTINDRTCSMIKFGSQREACIDNESGIAVYHKFQDQTFYLEDAKQIDIADDVFNPAKI